MNATLRPSKSYATVCDQPCPSFHLAIVPTYQPSHFGRVYAAYGGSFIVLSILWGWLVDHVEPDRFDVIGAMVCLAGVAVMMYGPR
ncbi:MAG: YnfA family protein [Fimbriimonadaceae bacterium]|nr:YnfA family protein [Fimbriimonadaceae bacterium]